MIYSLNKGSLFLVSLLKEWRIHFHLVSQYIDKILLSWDENIFDNVATLGSKSLILKYQKFTPLGCKDKGIGKFDFVAKITLSLPEKGVGVAWQLKKWKKYSIHTHWHIWRSNNCDKDTESILWRNTVTNYKFWAFFDFL